MFLSYVNCYGVNASEQKGNCSRHLVLHSPGWSCRAWRRRWTSVSRKWTGSTRKWKACWTKLHRGHCRSWPGRWWRWTLCGVTSPSASTDTPHSTTPQRLSGESSKVWLYTPTLLKAINLFFLLQKSRRFFSAGRPHWIGNASDSMIQWVSMALNMYWFTQSDEN